MKKCICLCLALLLVLGGAALAENVIGGADGPTSIYLAPTVVTPEDGRYVLIARAETDGTYSYALVGAGTGEEAMALFGGAGASEERIAAFTRFAAALEPAVTRWSLCEWRTEPFSPSSPAVLRSRKSAWRKAARPISGMRTACSNTAWAVLWVKPSTFVPTAAGRMMALPAITR